MFDAKAISLISLLVTDIASKMYIEIENDGRIGRLTANELESAILEYGRTIIPLPDEAIQLFDVCEVDDVIGGWAVDVPLWTMEEGRSDLTLSVTIIMSSSVNKITIDDMHVL